MTLPIACSLTPDQYRRRVSEAGHIARGAVRSREPIAGGARLIFDTSPALRDRLEDFVAGESECCPFLDMRLGDGDGVLVLDVTGPEAAAPIIEELFA